MKRNLQLGEFAKGVTGPLEVAPADIAYHTALLAQSGSGKSFLLGRLVEEIILKTRARVLVLDANGDFRKMDEGNHHGLPLPPRDYGTVDEFLEDWTSLVAIVKLRNDRVGGRALVPWWDYDLLEQSEILGLETASPEFSLLRQLYEKNVNGRVERIRYAPQDVADESLPPLSTSDVNFTSARRPLAEKMRRLGDWGIWQRPADTDVPLRGVIRQEGGSPWDLLVVDLPSIRARQGQLFCVAYVLAELWRLHEEQWADATEGPREEDDRVPTFIVIDEVHRCAPREPRDLAQQQIADHLQQIAAEGRKYGLFLILATQRPAKVQSDLLAECENVCLMRLQSPVDHGIAADAWGIDRRAVALHAPGMGVGEGLLYGRWATGGVTFFKAAPRRTAEGGASLRPEVWTRARIDVTEE